MKVWTGALQFVAFLLFFKEILIWIRSNCKVLFGICRSRSNWLHLGLLTQFTYFNQECTTYECKTTVDKSAYSLWNFYINLQHFSRSRNEFFSSNPICVLNASKICALSTRLPWIWGTSFVCFKSASRYKNVNLIMGFLAWFLGSPFYPMLSYASRTFV